MRYATVCSGIEAPSVAWEPLGFEPVWFSEIEKFPCAVLKHHYPSVPNYGDMTKWKEWPNDGTVELICGGCPCQAFSVAGLRKGLDDPRGNLTLVFLALLSSYKPRFVLYENVPGILSDKTGAFDSFIYGLQDIGYGVAWTILDAQYFGLAQRRERVFVVGCLGNWQRSAAVLFDKTSMCWYPAPSRKKGQGTAADVAQSITGSGRGVARTGESRGQDTVCAVDVCGALAAHMGGGNQFSNSGQFVAHPLRTDGFDASEDGTGRGTPIVPEVAPTLNDVGGHSRPGDGDTSCALTGDHASRPTDYTPVVCFKGGQGEKARSLGLAEEQSPTLPSSDSGSNRAPVVCHSIDMRNAGRDTDKHDAINRQGVGIGGAGEPAHTVSCAHVNAVATQYAVRRITPVEAERLQGFPDGYTRIPWRGKPAEQCPDGPRYKALGNSMAVPVIRWIGERIQAVDSI